MCACWIPPAQTPTSPPAFPNVLKTHVCACVYFYSSVQCSSPRHSHLLLQTTGTAWCPSTVLQPPSSPSTIEWIQQAGKKLLLNFEICVGSLTEAGEWGLKPWVAKILTSESTAFPYLNLSIFKCYLSQHRASVTSLGLLNQLMNQSKSEWNWVTSSIATGKNKLNTPQSS